MNPYLFGTIALATILAGCNAQQSANLQNAAIISCNAATIASAAAVDISADVNASAQAQKDAATAQKVTVTACAALQKLPTVITASGTLTPAAQAVLSKWHRDMPASVLNSSGFQKLAEQYHFAR